MVGMRKMTENIIKTAMEKREIMERINRVVGDPMTMIEVTRITVLRGHVQAGMNGMRHHRKSRLSCQDMKKIQPQSTSRKVCI